MFPKRGAFAVFVTIVALVALLGYKTPEPALPVDSGASFYAADQTDSPLLLADASSDPAGSGDGSAPTADVSASPSVGPNSSTSAGASAASTPAPTRRPTPRPTHKPTPRPGRTGSTNGLTVDTIYGPVQVRLVYSGGRITDAICVQTPNSRSTSRDINQMACPKLRSEVLKAQSSKIDTVSGATYTSNAYKISVQYAIDHP